MVLQEFELAASVVAGEGNRFFIGEKQFEPGKDFQPFSFSENGSFTGEVVFAGYGFED
ncbi:MAG: hypothetical protein R2727_05125 [Bacteroidales bacterium]